MPIYTQICSSTQNTICKAHCTYLGTLLQAKIYYTIYTWSHTAVILPAASQLLLCFILPRLFLFFNPFPVYYFLPFVLSLSPCKQLSSVFISFFNMSSFQSYLLSLLCKHPGRTFCLHFISSLLIFHIIHWTPAFIFVLQENMFHVLGQRDLAILKRNTTHSLQAVILARPTYQ